MQDAPVTFLFGEASGGFTSSPFPPLRGPPEASGAQGPHSSPLASSSCLWAAKLGWGSERGRLAPGRLQAGSKILIKHRIPLLPLLRGRCFWLGYYSLVLRELSVALKLRGTCKVGKIKITPALPPSPQAASCSYYCLSLSRIVAGLLRSAFGSS